MDFTITEGMTHDRRPTRNRSRDAKAKARNTGPIEFVCIDGEGITLWEGCFTAHAKLTRIHRYVLLGVGDNQIENPDGLTWEECFGFLWSQFHTGPTAYTGFFLGYDFVQMLRSLREERARMLLTAEGRAKRKPTQGKRVMPFPVECNGWEFDILGSKRLKIRPKGESRWMSICDTGPFFQKSFLSVINPENWSEPVVTQEQYDRLVAGKGNRGVAVLDDDMRRYNREENAALSTVLGRLDDGLRSLGIELRPNQWFGPGQAASAWLEGRAVTAGELQNVTQQPVLEAARSAYYGGWFEIMAHGIVPGTTYEYDINSAYPYIISTLPCLLHGRWEHNGKSHGDRSFSLVRASVRGSGRHMGSMLHRDDCGNISRPSRTEGWYWLDELDAAYRAGCFHDVRTFESWAYHPCDCPPPLREVRNIYDLRQRVGKKTPLGIACKLVPNSLYGKFAQSIGSPEYGNPIYASRITSGCRTMILDATATHPSGTRAVLMVATDGVYFQSPHPGLTIGPNLGEWDAAEKENLCLFKPGVYWDDKARASVAAGDAPVFKARGVNARDFGSRLEYVDNEFRALRESRPDRIAWPTVTFPIGFSLVSGLQALQRGDWSLAGTLNHEATNRQSSDPSLKRSNWHWNGDLLRSTPNPNDPYEASRPYEKRFGMADPWSQESAEENGISPDGLPGDLWKEALYGE